MPDNWSFTHTGFLAYLSHPETAAHVSLSKIVINTINFQRVTTELKQ